MLNKKHKLLELKTSKLIDSLFVGNYKTKFKGKGIEFADFKEYDFGDDIKNIDFIKSEKEGKILVKLFEEERELSVYFILDLNDSFLENYLNKKTKKDILLEILYLIGLSAIKSGDKVGAFISKNSDKKLFISKKGKQNFINIINSIEKNLPFSKGVPEGGGIKNNILFFISNFKNIFKNNSENKINIIKYFNNLKITKSLVFFVSDSLEYETKDLKILSSKNDLIFCNIFNSFENSLNGDGLIGVEKLGFSIDLDNKSKIYEYKKIREEKINSLRKNINKYGGKYIFLDEQRDIYKEFYKLFKI